MRSVVPAGTRRVVNLLPSVKTLGYLRVREQTAGRDGVCVVRIGEREHSTSQGAKEFDPKQFERFVGRAYLIVSQTA